MSIARFGPDDRCGVVQLGVGINYAGKPYPDEGQWICTLLAGHAGRHKAVWHSGAVGFEWAPYGAEEITEAAAELRALDQDLAQFEASMSDVPGLPPAG